MNKSLHLLLSVNSVFVIAANLIGPLYAVYIERLGGNLAIASASWSVMLLTITLVNLLLVRFGDRIKEHEYFLIAGYGIRAFVWLGFAFAGNFPTVFLLQVILGIAEALGTTGFDAIFAEHLDRSNHIKDYAVWKTVSNIAAAMATLLGGLIVSFYGFVPVFIMMSIIAFVCAVFTFIQPRKAL